MYLGWNNRDCHQILETILGKNTLVEQMIELHNNYHDYDYENFVELENIIKMVDEKLPNLLYLHCWLDNDGDHVALEIINNKSFKRCANFIKLKYLTESISNYQLLCTDYGIDKKIQPTIYCFLPNYE